MCEEIEKRKEIKNWGVKLGRRLRSEECEVVWIGVR